MSIGLFYLLGSVVLDIMANLSLEHSDGFRRRRWGALAVVAIMSAFALLALAVQTLDLFMAYAIWGVLSITGTALATWMVFGQRLNWISWLGISLLILAILLMRLGG
ncbi:SMR family transporter [Marinobacterium sediminicola]|uniref:Spermidine export protein MdtI n=1 Tax=Marinobacterium sediminicola TaxID=518898 RepID=A0ABY1S0X2_9GAMM|nr:SMR family transporter [Marinobacterium sediminicola]ULG70091.1 SMR family transporter [Marinobacterium sediminicola]SMR74904.1 spermidine export protein MdtI [Marinobacterium sediminicola]